MSASPVTPCWNPNHALKRLGGDRQLLLELVQIFIEEAPTQLQRLCQAVAAGNCRDAEHAAHRLKGDLGYLGAVELAEWARTLEGAAHNGDVSHSETTLATLKTNLEAAFSVLHALCADYQAVQARK